MTIQTKKQRILVIKNRAIGDTLLMTGPLRILKQHFPHHEIHACVRSPAGELLEGLPWINRIISAQEPQGKLNRFAYWMRLVKKLRTLRYAFVLNFHASWRTALTAQYMRSDLCLTNHHELKGRNWFSDQHVPGRGVVKPIIDRDLDLLRALGIPARLEDAMPEIRLTQAERKKAKTFFSSSFHKEGRKKIFLGLGASRETKRWPFDLFKSFTQKLLQVEDVEFVCSLVPEDAKRFNLGFLEDRLHFFQGLTLRETAMILSECQVYVGNDSGLKHAAVGLGLKTLTFFGPESPFEWHPYETAKHPYLYIENLPCRTLKGKHWCAIPECKQYQHQCMQELQPEEAVKITQTLLKT